MSIRRSLTLALALVAVSAMFASSARAQDVSVDYDHAVDFSAYKTFSIELGTSWGNPFGEKRVQDELTAAFTAKGWTVAPAESADARIVFHGATETKRNLNTFYSGRGGYRYGGFGSATTTVSEFTVGTLVVDVFDAKTKALLWRGTAQDEVKAKEEKRAKQLGKATDKLLKDFPPAKSKG